MKLKGILSAALSVLMICTATGTAAMAAEAAPDTQSDSSEVAGVQQKLQVTEMQLTDSGYITGAPLDSDGNVEEAQAVRLNLSDDTVYLDTQTGAAADPADIKTGDTIYAYYSAAMTRSIPPQAACYAVLVNLDDQSAPAHFLTAGEITDNPDGSVKVLTQDGSMLVTVGKDAPIAKYADPASVTNADIKTGTRFFAWYDFYATSYPGQAGAVKVVLLPGTADAFQYGEPYPYRLSMPAVITEVRVATYEGDILLVPSVTVQTDEGKTMTVNLGETTWFVDGKTGSVSRWTDVNEQKKVLQKGAGCTVYYNQTESGSEPAQVTAEAFILNADSETATAAPHLLTAESVTQNADGSVTLLSNNGTTQVAAAADMPFSSAVTDKAVQNTDIRMGSELIAWYASGEETDAGQVRATKAVLLPNRDRALTIIAYGDTAIGTAKVENGVVMVPLRLVAETLGFTVTWDGQEECVHLTNGTVQTTVRLGEDGYYKATAIPGAVGLTAMFSLGAPSYETDGTTWAPAELLNLLLGKQVIRLHDSVLYIS